MTRKDYVKIAETIKQARYRSADPQWAKALDVVSMNLAFMLSEESSSFDSVRWFQACELGKLPREEEVTSWEKHRNFFEKVGA